MTDMGALKHIIPSTPMFKTIDELPEKAFFPKDYIARYKLHIRELIKRMNHLLEEVDNFEDEGQSSMEWNGTQLATLSRETVWYNLEALQDCGDIIKDVVELFKQKIRESNGMVATDPTNFEPERRIVSPKSSSVSAASASEYSSEGESEDDLPEGFQDVEPVKSRKIARALNDDVIARIKNIYGTDEGGFETFKEHALHFGTGEESAKEFYTHLTTQMTEDQIRSIIIDFARLLPHANLRRPLLKQHYLTLEMNQRQPLDTRNKSWSQMQGINTVADTTRQQDFDDSDEDDIDAFPTTLRLETINHLVFIIHGIGQHVDFQEGEFKSWDGQAGLQGGNHAFRDLFRTMLETMFRDIPVGLEMQSIEWHEDLHEPTGVDDVFDLICPEGAAGVREFNKETLMDVLYYISPHYGQLIVDSVTQQLNQKYRTFIEEHPGWDGQVSIFAHSLGSVIAYDILTHQAGDIARNNVQFPGLEFTVDNFFAVGSPVPVMILSRGDLNIEDGQFHGGITLPSCNRYYNIFHPIDPIAYRIEPLIQQDMHDKPPVQLISAHSVRDAGFTKIQAMLERITAPVHGFAYRMDYVLKRRKREQGMMEIAYASASHSSYWMSEDVVMFTIMQLCKPVVEKLQRYMSAQRPIPVLMRNIIELTPHTKVIMSSNARIRDRCTGFWYERIVLCAGDRLYVLPRLQVIACRPKWRMMLTPSTKALYGEDSFTLKVVGILENEENTASSPPPSYSSSSSSFVRSKPGSESTFILKATTTPIRDEWLSLINHTILKSGGGHPHAPPSQRLQEKPIHLVDVPSDVSIDFFSSLKTGFLHERTPKGWYEGWKERWIVLQEHQLTCYENSPRLEFIGQFKLHKSTIFCYEPLLLFRIISRSGTSLEMGVHDIGVFMYWMETFSHVATVTMIRQSDLIENSPSAVRINPPGTIRSSLEPIQIKIEGYDLKYDEKGGQYATFQIQILSIHHGIKLVRRRYSEFHKLHRQLRKIFPHEQIPSFPSTRLWNKYDAAYLKEKTVQLHGYLTEVCRRCTIDRGQAILLEFLELESSQS